MPKKTKNKSEDTETENSYTSYYLYKKSVIIPILIIIIEIYAFYLAFKCKDGFIGFLSACCCPIIYVPYKLLTKC